MEVLYLDMSIRLKFHTSLNWTLSAVDISRSGIHWHHLLFVCHASHPHHGMFCIIFTHSRLLHTHVTHPAEWDTHGVLWRQKLPYY